MRLTIFFLAALVLISSDALAQSTASCANPPVFAKLPDAAISQFRANPQGLATPGQIPLALEMQAPYHSLEALPYHSMEALR